MLSPFLIITITGILVAAACALIGSFLVVRKMGMMSDAIAHAILPGLVAGYFVAQGPNLLAGFAGAVLAGLVTVSFVEFLLRTKLVKQDAAIGIAFSAMFALGTFLVTKYFSQVHLDADAILYGTIEFASFDTLYIGDINMGPQSFWLMGGVLLLNSIFLLLLYKELKLSTFDPQLATSLGYTAPLIHYVLMILVTITTVAAFSAVGAVLTVALIIVPAATAYLLTNRLHTLISVTVLTGSLAAAFGNSTAQWLDISVSGSMATMTGVFFLLAFLFSPLHGLIATQRKRLQLQIDIALRALVIHLYHHEQSTEASQENSLQNIARHFHWKSSFTHTVLRKAKTRHLIEQEQSRLLLTEKGRSFAKEHISTVMYNKQFGYS